LVAAGIVTRGVYFEAAGAVVLLLSLVWTVVSWRRHLARIRPPQSKAGSASGRSAGSDRQGGWRARLMERMEERWRRRQERNGRM
jgi:hypothetical protein